MKKYILDTNTVSHLIKGNGSVVQRVTNVPLASLFISAITAAELFYGLAKRPEAKRLHQAVDELLKRIDVLSWSLSTAEIYGALKVTIKQAGKSLSAFDLLIATQAVEVGGILVTNDRTFFQVPGLATEGWVH